MRFELIISSVIALITVYTAVETKTFSTGLEAETYNDTYTFVEQMPQIIGGVGELYHVINASQSIDSWREISCEIFLEFIVQSNGEVKNAKSLSTNFKECDKPALTALKEMKFKPGYHLGNPVPVLTTMPLRFVMKE